MRLRDIIAILLIVVVAVGGKYYRMGQEHPPPERRPDPRQFEPAPPPLPEVLPNAGRALAPPKNSDPSVLVEVETKQRNAVGTAFSLNRSGVWITAHHVTEGCDLVVLQRNDGKAVAVRRIVQERHADISVLWTRGGTPALPVSDPPLAIGEDGYSFGFPHGRPGDVHGRIIGNARLVASGRYQKTEPVIAWTQVRRIPDDGANLGGISGGPWLNRAGDVIGVHVAGSPRRGRSYSTTPQALLAALSNNGISPAPDRAALPARGDLAPSGFDNYGNELRRRQIVAKVICLVGEKWRRRAASPSG